MISVIPFEVQLDFFKTKEEVLLEDLQTKHEKLRISTEKVRKGMYAELNALKKRIVELEEQNKILIENICKGKIDFKK